RAVGCAQATASGLPCVLHRMGRERRYEIRGRRLRLRPQTRRPQLRSTIACLVLVASCLYGPVSPSAGPADRPSKFDTHAAALAIAFAAERSAYRDLSTFLLPGPRLSLEPVG